MVFKKCIGRYICYMIGDTTMALAATVLLAFWELLSVITLRQRDKLIYRLQLMNTDGDKDELAERVMKHPRNMLLRIRNAHNETVLEVCFITTSLFLVLSSGVSTAPAPGFELAGADLVQNFFQQWVVEMFVDLLCILWLTVMDRQPVIATSHKLFRGWTFVMSLFVACANDHCERTAARSQHTAQGLWALCSSVPLFQHCVALRLADGNGFYIVLNVIPFTYAHLSSTSACENGTARRNASGAEIGVHHTNEYAYIAS